jgi:hypothetical protein
MFRLDIKGSRALSHYGRADMIWDLSQALLTESESQYKRALPIWRSGGPLTSGEDERRGGEALCALDHFRPVGGNRGTLELNGGDTRIQHRWLGLQRMGPAMQGSKRKMELSYGTEGNSVEGMKVLGTLGHARPVEGRSRFSR